MRIGRNFQCTALAAAVLGAVVGCNSIVQSDTREAKQARVVVTGTSPVPLKLTISRDFNSERDPDTGQTTYTINTSTVTTINVPFDSIFAFSESQRMLVRLTNPDANTTASIRLQVLVDNQNIYDQTATLRDASLQVTYFSF